MNELRLIDANALKYKNLAEVNGKLTYVLTAEEINNAPTVEIPDCDTCTFTKPISMPEWERLTNELNELDKKVKELERPQGEWIEGFHEHFETLDCSCCGYVRNERHLTLNFCPNCGAKMKQD